MEQSYYVGWVTLALINATLGQIKNNADGRQRGSGGFAWFLVSLLLGPIATFLIAVTNNPKSNKPLSDKE